MEREKRGINPKEESKLNKMFLLSHSLRITTFGLVSIFIIISNYKVKNGSNLESSWRVINFNELIEIKEEILDLDNALQIWDNQENSKLKNNASITLAFSRHPLDILSIEFSLLVATNLSFASSIKILTHSSRAG